MSSINNVPPHETWYETPIGWASEDGGTTGGGKNPQLLYYVRNIEELRQAIAESGDRPKCIWIGGVIDASGGIPYTNRQDQSKRGRIFIGSNTTLIGMDHNAKFIASALFIQDANNVIVHNLFIENPVDVEPQFEEGDGWNAEWDGLSIVNSHHVWVNNVTFSDGRFTMDMYKTVDGWKYVQHDGSLDIKRASNYITVSHCVFTTHDKTILIGHSDSNGEQDAGKLRVTFHDNLFTNVVQRTPRVRFGNIHLFNNVFDNDIAAPVYKYQYSFGVGKESRILSELNIFKVKGLTEHCKLFKEFGGVYLSDSESTFNKIHSDDEWGTDRPPLSLNGCGFNSTSVDRPPYNYFPQQNLTEDVENSIRDAAGNQFNYRVLV
ncbi:pectate lyase [Serratia sp. UGAL515B_01]|uniref:pectate lyase family protein n=1 Tax=Serratia sp. UGAL515B_01 TaxID=2986763 RepID=UPI00295497F4|nr:pectate lyase [Serratia sp. UGAL515B_01]WON78659.1 polysaccharide lyase [Serratia sp. UGAL515B_01]